MDLISFISIASDSSDLRIFKDGCVELRRLFGLCIKPKVSCDFLNFVFHDFSPLLFSSLLLWSGNENSFDKIRLNTLKVPFHYTPFILNQDNDVKLGCVLCFPTDHLTNPLNPLLVTISFSW
jgi:hypothetical protein